MKRNINFAVVLLVLTFLCTPTFAVVVDFEDLYPGYETDAILPPAGYGGLNWSSDFGVITKKYWPGSGYDLGTIGYMAGYTRYANPVFFSDGAFTFNGAYINAAWDENENVIVNGYLNNSLVYTRTVMTHNDNPYWFDFNWTVDKVEFLPQGAHVAFDNITYNAPEPATMLLLGSGLLGLWGLRRRFRK